MPDDPSADYGAFSFLVIDDEPFVQKVLVQILERLGAGGVATASNGVEALDHLDAAETAPDVLLIDLAMPEMGGVELLRNLAERTFEGAVILVSGADAETLDVAEGLAKYRGINLLGYITKPVKPEALDSLLAEL